MLSPQKQTELEERITASLHGGLNAAEQQDLENYLAEHPEQQKVREEIHAMSHFLDKNIRPHAAEPGFEERMVARFRRNRPSHSIDWRSFVSPGFRSRIMPWVGATAVIVLAFFLGNSGDNSNERQRGGIYWGTRDSKPLVLSGYVDVDGMQFSSSPEKSRSVVPRPTEAPAAEAPSETAKKLVDSRENLMHPSSQTQLMAKAKEAEAMPGTLPNLSVVLPAPSDAMSQTDHGLAQSQSQAKFQANLGQGTADLVMSPSTGSNRVQTSSAPLPDPRKLIRNASVTLEVANYATATSRLTQMAKDRGGFVSTEGDRTQANGRSVGEMVIKIPPDQLDDLMHHLSELGAIKDQVIKTDDVTKDYYDTQARLRNAGKTEERLLELMAQKTDKVADLLQVEKEIARVRESIEQMQGEIKLWDSLAMLATLTIEITEKDLDQAAEYLLKENAQLSIFSPDVEKTYQEARSLAEKSQAQILSAQANLQDGGQTSSTLSLLVAPEQSLQLIEQLKSLGRVNSFTMNSQRVAQDGQSGVEAGTTRKDKVQIDVSILFDDQSHKTVNLRLVTPEIEKALDQGKKKVAEAHGDVLTSTMQLTPDGHVSGELKVRLPASQVREVQEAFVAMGRVTELTVQRNDATGVPSEADDQTPVILDLNLADEEAPVQITHLDIQTEKVGERIEELKKLARDRGFGVRGSTFAKGADGRETASVVFRLPQKDYNAFLPILQEHGLTLALTLQRQDRVTGQTNHPESDPVEIDFSLISAPPEVSFQAGFVLSIRHTLEESFGVLASGFERVITGLTYLLPWLLLGGVGYGIWRWLKNRR